MIWPICLHIVTLAKEAVFPEEKKKALETVQPVFKGLLDEALTTSFLVEGKR